MHGDPGAQSRDGVGAAPQVLGCRRLGERRFFCCNVPVDFVEARDVVLVPVIDVAIQLPPVLLARCQGFLKTSFGAGTATPVGGDQ